MFHVEHPQRDRGCFTWNALTRVAGVRGERATSPVGSTWNTARRHARVHVEQRDEARPSATGDAATRPGPDPCSRQEAAAHSGPAGCLLEPDFRGRRTLLFHVKPRVQAESRTTTGRGDAPERPSRRSMRKAPTRLHERHGRHLRLASAVVGRSPAVGAWVGRGSGPGSCACLWVPGPVGRAVGRWAGRQPWVMGRSPAVVPRVDQGPGPGPCAWPCPCP
jgi:hypothetical protein